MEKKKPKITLGCLSENPRTLEITQFVRRQFSDHRLITVAKDEDGKFLLSVENPGSTGRATKSQMYLTEESLTALFYTYILFTEHFDIDIEALLQRMTSGEYVNYEYYPPLEEQPAHEEE